MPDCFCISAYVSANAAFFSSWVIGFFAVLDVFSGAALSPGVGVGGSNG